MSTVATAILVTLFTRSSALGTCVAPTSNQIDDLGVNGDQYLCLPPDFTITTYASGYDTDEAMVKPRIMDSIIYNDNLIVYAGSVKDWAPDFTLVVGTRVRAMVDTDMDGVRDTTVDVYNNSNEEFNVVTIDPVTDYVYLVSQENMYQCTNMHAYTMDLVNGDGIVTSPDCRLFIAFPGVEVELTHARHYAEFSQPDSRDLCVAFGADCDNCVNPDVPRTTIRCYDMSLIRDNYSIDDYPIAWNASESRTVAYGVRNSVGFDWHPVTYDLWFTDNGSNDVFKPTAQYNHTWREHSPDDELNVITTGNEGGHYGYPFVHTEGSGNIYIRDLNNVSLSFEDPNLWDDRPTGMQYNDFVLAKQAMSPHSAVLGMKFYNRDKLIEDNCAAGRMPKLFPESYNNKALIAEHGSWADQWGGYGIVTGYRVVTVDIDTSDNSISSLENFVYGFRAENQSCGVCGGVYDGTGTNVAWARPGFIEILYDGSVLISDDTGHYVFRVQYDGSDAMDYECPTDEPSKTPTMSPTFDLPGVYVSTSGVPRGDCFAEARSCCVPFGPELDDTNTDGTLPSSKEECDIYNTMEIEVDLGIEDDPISVPLTFELYPSGFTGETNISYAIKPFGVKLSSELEYLNFTDDNCCGFYKTTGQIQGINTNNFGGGIYMGLGMDVNPPSNEYVYEGMITIPSGSSSVDLELDITESDVFTSGLSASLFEDITDYESCISKSIMMVLVITGCESTGIDGCEPLYPNTLWIGVKRSEASCAMLYATLNPSKNPTKSPTSPPTTMITSNTENDLPVEPDMASINRCSICVYVILVHIIYLAIV